jgi:SAM-dependent methyltransferase
MAVDAAYDAISDWYESYVTGPAAGFTERVQWLLARLLGAGSGPCLDLGCGTGVNAAPLRRLGWTPLGVDVSPGQLGHARRRMPVAVGDAVALPARPAAVAAVASVLCHTDVDDYAAVVREAARVLRPGGRFVHVGVHPCFVGAFADRSDPARITVDPGYHRTERRFAGWSPHGVRARVGAVQLPLPALLHAALAAGLRLTGVEEAGPELADGRAAVPDVFGFAAVKAAGVAD